MYTVRYILLKAKWVKIIYTSLLFMAVSFSASAMDGKGKEFLLNTYLISEPFYDSGWVDIAPGELKTLTHNLGGNVDEYVVHMQFKNLDQRVNQCFYGGADYGANPEGDGTEDDRVGAYWRSLDNSTIVVYRRPEDTYARSVRIRIWQDNAPDYDSGWIALTKGSITQLDHNLGGSLDDYVVDMQFKSKSNGINHCFYGGADYGANPEGGSTEDDRVGAYWRSLDMSSIVVYRRPEDTYAPEVRIRLWKRPTPTWDSGWTEVKQDEVKAFFHSVMGHEDDYTLDVQFRSSLNGVNHIYYGGMDLGALYANEDDCAGAYWRGSGTQLAYAKRRINDSNAEEMRVRIWNIWTPTPPDYDSDWVNIPAGGSATLVHNLYPATDNFLVKMWFKHPTFGIHTVYYGGIHINDVADPLSANQRLGAYWKKLYTDISVVRLDEDTMAPDLRVKIWDMPTPDYISDWQYVPQGSSKQFVHNLGGRTEDYLVDLQFKSTLAGINQCYYGGTDFGINPPEYSAEGDRVGAYWRSLDPSSITVYRRQEDSNAAYVLVRIWRIAKPHYDSGWISINPGDEKELVHHLPGNHEGLLVDMWNFSSGPGTNTCYYGGADAGPKGSPSFLEGSRVGTCWYSLGEDTIKAKRREEDMFATYVKIRMWQPYHRAARYTFEASPEGWGFAGEVPPYDEPIPFGQMGKIALSPDGSTNAFSYLYSPEVLIRDEGTYRARWSVGSTVTTPDDCVQFRLRANQKIAWAGWERIVNSFLSHAPCSLATKDYDLFFNPRVLGQEDGKMIFSFDILSFSPDDDYNSWIYLSELVVDEVCAMTINEVLHHSFHSDACGWTFQGAVPPFDCPISTAPPPHLGLTAPGTTNAFSYWYSPELPITPDTIYRLKWSVDSTVSDPDDAVQLRLRVNQVGSWSSWVRVVNSNLGLAPYNSCLPPYDMIISPAVVGSEDNRIISSFDLLSFDPNDDINSTLRFSNFYIEEVKIVPNSE